MTFCISENIDLQPFCTLAIPAKARFFCVATCVDDIRQALDFARTQELPFMVLGGGSNVVMKSDFSGLVIHMALRGIDLQANLPPDADAGINDKVYIAAAAGEPWQALVDFSLAHGLWGLENLNLIPGTVGAAPIQNIGAYGVELDQVFYDLQALRVSDGELVVFSKSACEFSYRDSFFKRTKGEYIIVSVRLCLSHKGVAKLAYPGLADHFDPVSLGALVPSAVAERVAELRRAKLPDPTVIPNAGSFFHNPIVDSEQAEHLRSLHPDIVSYAQADGRYKLAAAWLIDRAGLKGELSDGVGVHAHQALVLINPGRREGINVLNFARRIADRVEALFGVRLIIEPQIYP
ncbi:UDP-N-acetylmuramate dehydrogenase [Simiduia curdlanivorans]|uniref:UDP-N-acetylenolpyruvoylglucosamine reductase n=1 Tax=Simiduia curdlanivorans TaxID=1492769 RepID=A0ABV8V821_9GAMM|nr:UDP-N-acetylmuramate dehydrogenase [Simiduia curdlanivorans]MDN3639624.1 UDP-N-acetylmuramate dehydrogenase [Simiduia curdlanivorans]